MLPTSLLLTVFFSTIVFLLGSNLASERTPSESNPSTTTPSILSDRINIDQNHRSLRAPYFDPKTVTLRQTEYPLFVVPKAYLDDTKHAEPTFISVRPADPGNGRLVVDVLSIGSRTRPELLKAQMETWASHVSVRNFWGVTEQQDYDVNCADGTNEESFQLFIDKCWPDGNPRKYRGWGWFCAQRRPGHALGWLQKAYQDVAMIPDVLMLVDDDTSVDVEEVLRQMSLVQEVIDHSPYVGNPCKLEKKWAGVGGSGTFFNRAALEVLTRPIFCDDRQQESMNSACENLQKNSIGELFQQGDSVFDVFYKYSALREFCVHSDAAIAHMVNVYTGTILKQIGPCQGRQPCHRGQISCHYQTPEMMKEFTIARTCPLSPFVGYPCPAE